MRSTLAALGVVLALTTGAGAQERVGAVAALEGQAQARHRNAAEDVPLATGADVLLGDRLHTLADSRLKVLLRDDSVLTLAAASELTVDEQVVGGGAPASTVSLAAGAVRAVVSQAYGAPGAHFDVQTPTAVAGVRGTTFVVAYDPATGATDVVVAEGVVTVRALSDAAGRHAVRVRKGERTRVPRDGNPATPQSLGGDAARDALLGTSMPAGGRDPAVELPPPGGPAAPDAALPQAPGADPQSPSSRAIDQPVQDIRNRLRQQVPPPPPGSPGRSRH